VPTTITRPTDRLTRILLSAGPRYAVLYVAANDVVAARLCAGYDPVSQTVSELSATGSPAKALSPPSPPSGRR
jgi:hypothetical protein